MSPVRFAVGAVLVAGLLVPGTVSAYAAGVAPEIGDAPTCDASGVTVTWETDAGKPTNINIYSSSNFLLKSYRAISGPEWDRGSKTVAAPGGAAKVDISNRFGTSLRKWICGYTG